MSDIRKLFQASSHYLWANVFSTLASLVSFPILTRILSVPEYGLLALFNTSLLFGVAVSKLGMQNSVARYFAEYRRDGKLDTFYSTFTLGGVLIGGTVAVLGFMIIFVAVRPDWRSVLCVVTLVMFTETMGSLFVNFLRSEERSKYYALFSILGRSISLTIGLGLVYIFRTGIVGIFWGSLFSGAVVLGLIAHGYLKRYRIRSEYFSWILFKEALRYGTPLILFEMAAIVLAYSDQFLITRYRGITELGIYSAGYSLCTSIAGLVKMPVSLAVTPIYIRLWEEEGPEATHKFIHETLGYYFLAVLPIFFGFIAVQSDVVTLMASKKYLNAVVIIPWVLGSILLFFCNPIFAAGYYIRKQTASLTTIFIGSCVLNISLNILLIPKYGIVAAAWTTALTYVVATIAIVLKSLNTFRIRWPIRRIALYGLASLAMYLILGAIGEFLNLPMKIFVGAFSYVIIVCIFDRTLAKKIFQRHPQQK